jgi:hypothetical protein
MFLAIKEIKSELKKKTKKKVQSEASPLKIKKDDD